MKKPKTKDELKEEILRKLRSVKPKQAASPRPRYDDVFFDGVAWLDGLD